MLYNYHVWGIPLVTLELRIRHLWASSRYWNCRGLTWGRKLEVESDPSDVCGSTTIARSHVASRPRSYAELLPKLTILILFLGCYTWPRHYSRWEVSFTPLALYPWYPLDMRLGGPQNRSERYGEVKNLDPKGARTPTPRSSRPVHKEAYIDNISVLKLRTKLQLVAV
jgi:hypothetical protein